MDRLGDLIQATRPRRDGDIVDRLNYAYTSTLLAVFASLAIGWSFVGSPLHCWYPPYFKKYWVEYGNEYCFIQNNYFIKIHSRQPADYGDVQNTIVQLPNNTYDRMEKILPYYQWAPFVLAAQALMFFFPVVLWRSANGSSGLCVDTILVESAKNEQSTVDTIAKFLANYSDISTKLKKSKPQNRRFVTWLYISVKFLFAFNAIMQFVLMNEFLGMGDLWGAKVFSDFMSGRSWEESGAFPRVTMCDFRVRAPNGNLHHHTVQCVLLINMFYEKFYTGFWFWLLFLATINIISLIQWITVAVTYKSRRFVTEYINWFKSRGQDTPVQSYGPVVDKFIEYLGQDGIMLLRLINTNAGGLVTGTLMERLWDNFMEKRRHVPPDSGISTRNASLNSSKAQGLQDVVYSPDGAYQNIVRSRTSPVSNESRSTTSSRSKQSTV